MRVTNSIVSLIFFSLCCHSSAQAYDKGNDIEGDGAIEINQNFEEWRFQEDVVDLPEYPKQSGLMKINIDAPDANFKYFIDPKSLNIGVNDVTVQVTSVIEARSGFQNVFYESYRCDSLEYKTIAYGTGKKTFYQLRDPQWKKAMQRGGTGLDFRRDLVSTYLCDTGSGPLALDEILYRVKNPRSISDESGGF